MDKVSYITEKKHFKYFPEACEEIKKLIRDGKVTDLFIGFRMVENGEYRIGYHWFGQSPLTTMLGMIEYLKMMAFSHETKTD